MIQHHESHFNNMLLNGISCHLRKRVRHCTSHAQFWDSQFWDSQLCVGWNKRTDGPVVGVTSCTLLKT